MFQRPSNGLPTPFQRLSTHPPIPPRVCVDTPTRWNGWECHTPTNRVRDRRPLCSCSALIPEARQAQARALAIRRFPALAPELARKKDADRAEALLIGAFGLHALAAAGAA